MRVSGVVPATLPAGPVELDAGSWWRAVAAALALAAVVVFGASLRPVASPRSTEGAVTLARLQWLPVQAQSVISAAVGAGQPAFAARRSRGGYRMAGGGVVAGFGAGGVRVQVPGGSLSMAFSGLGRGDRLSEVDSASPAGRANRVSFARAGVREWHAAGPLGIEQGFTVAERRDSRRARITHSW
jgi:hypothetical protein